MLVNVPIQSFAYEEPEPVVFVRETSVFEKILLSDLENVFFNQINEFAIPVQYYHNGFITYETYYGIFNAPGTIDTFRNVRLSNTEAKIIFNFNDIKTVPGVKDYCFVNGIKYNVKDYTPDGVGAVTVDLKRA